MFLKKLGQGLSLSLLQEIFGIFFTETPCQGLGLHPYSKTCFTMALPDVLSKLNSSIPTVDTVVLCGVETHVCIQATALDFMERGFSVSKLSQ